MATSSLVLLIVFGILTLCVILAVLTRIICGKRAQLGDSVDCYMDLMFDILLQTVILGDSIIASILITDDNFILTSNSSVKSRAEIVIIVSIINIVFILFKIIWPTIQESRMCRERKYEKTWREREKAQLEITKQQIKSVVEHRQRQIAQAKAKEREQKEHQEKQKQQNIENENKETETCTTIETTDKKNTTCTTTEVEDNENDKQTEKEKEKETNNKQEKDDRKDIDVGGSTSDAARAAPTGGSMTAPAPIPIPIPVPLPLPMFYDDNDDNDGPRRDNRRNDAPRRHVPNTSHGQDLIASFGNQTVDNVLIASRRTRKSLKFFQRVFPFIAGMADETFDIIAAIALLNGVDFTANDKLLIILSTYSGVFIEFIVLIGKIQSRFATIKRIESGKCAGVRCLGLAVIIEAVGILFECCVGLYLLFTIIGDNTDAPFFYTCVIIYIIIAMAGICLLPLIFRNTCASHQGQEEIYKGY